VHIDIGFGDVVTPGAIWCEYPTLLSFPSPRLRTYPKESVVAEKVHAMIVLGVANSRMKDFYDLWTLARLFPFDGATLAGAIRATFERRRTPIPQTTPTALTDEFAGNRDKINQWQGFLKRNRLDVDGATFAQVIDELRTFLAPPLQALAGDAPFRADWPAQGGWKTFLT
jgi:hypothetical protein